MIKLLQVCAASYLLVHSNPDLLKWIPPSCCVTQDCCWEISGGDVFPVTETEWKIKATNQQITVQHSPDGKFYRCACTKQTDGSWKRHDKAWTFCLFVPEIRLNM
jgi:hypothetical protein